MVGSFFLFFSHVYFIYRPMFACLRGLFYNTEYLGYLHIPHHYTTTSPPLHHQLPTTTYKLLRLSSIVPIACLVLLCIVPICCRWERRNNYGVRIVSWPMVVNGVYSARSNILLVFKIIGICFNKRILLLFLE